ncbi:hypothetical protein UFOVP567_25 [uncultured Caudovirales phage]|uniref:Uncharacterized protein n=1 Tax=uncultured Caudovirales phage TaxID=2100421 RepID=A0A6J5MT85_9CAUD|nr:hypothetical protein UFOVP567_25 [uncultured Caudovirales phage]
MPSVTPTSAGIVNIPGPLTRHQSGAIFTFAGTAGTAGSPTSVDWSTFSANAAGSRVGVDLSTFAVSSFQVWNLDGGSPIFVSVDDEDPTTPEASPVPALNGFQFDHPSASLAVAIWSAAGGEAFTVRAFATSTVVP